MDKPKTSRELWPVRVHMQLSREQDRALRRRAKAQHQPVAALLRDAVAEYLAKQP